MSEDESLALWLRAEIERDRAQARDLIESEAAAPVWTEPASGVLCTGPGEVDDCWAGTFPIGDSRITRFIAGRDPQWVLADCEAKMAILDEYEGAVKRRERERADYAAWTRGEAPYPRPTFNGPDPAVIPGLEHAVRLLASGYRHRPGYRAEWKP